MWRAHDLGQWLPMYPPFPAAWQMAIRPWHHVSTSPPCHPACLPAGRDSRFSRVRLATMAFLQAAFPGCWRFKRLLAYASRQPGLPLVSWLSHRITHFRHCVLQDRFLTTAMTESPFASSRRYLAEGGIDCRLDQHYPILIAPTGSCARPVPSFGLKPKLASAGLCRLLQAPAGNWPFPTLSL
jgi:hypothetical protein